jgi:hypothetical protein
MPGGEIFRAQGMTVERSRIMKYAVLLAGLAFAAASLAGAPAFAQDQAPAAAAAAAAPTEETTPAMRLEQGPAATAKPVARKRGTSRMSADARHCLDLPTNNEIIKCAERYL